MNLGNLARSMPGMVSRLEANLTVTWN